MALPQMPPAVAPGMGTPVNPDALLQMSLAVQEILEQQAELLLQPTYPKWYRPEDYPSPKPERVIEIASRLEGEFGAVRTRMLEEIELGRPDTQKHAVFKGDVEDVRNGDADQWMDTAISGEIELIAYQLADANVTFDTRARYRDEEDEAGKKIDFAVAAMEHARTLHARAGNGNLGLEKARTLLTTGRIAWHCMLDLDADEGEMPFVEALVDPTTCYPVFEAHRGMKLMVRRYRQTVGEAVAAHDTADGALTRRFILEPMAADPKKHKHREDEPVEVTEYWDRRWRYLFFDNVPAKPAMEHAYGFVPFVYKLSALGLPAYMRDPQADLGTTEFGYASLGSRDAAHKHKGVGLPTLLKMPTAMREAIYTRMLTAYGKFMDPPMVLEADDITYAQGVPEISRKTGDVSMIKKGHQTIQEIQSHPNTNVLGPLLQGVADNSARMMLPPTAHGQNEHSNVSGYATQGLNESGRVKLVPWLKTLEDFERECMVMRLRMFRDWGWMVNTDTENGDIGTIIVPRHEAAPGDDQVVDLSPGDLKRAGIDITVSMTYMPIQMLGPIANAIGIMMQLGIEDEIGAMRLLNTPNPYKKLERIRDNKFYNDPDYLEAKALKKLAEREPELAAYFMTKKMMAQQQEQMQQQAPPQQGPMGAMGDSQAAMGQGPGPGSGPQGPHAPTHPIGTE